MIDSLEHAALKQKKPFLGICVGMQMLFERGMEHGNHAGLGWLAGEVIRITPNEPMLNIPHMGWNELKLTSPHPFTEKIDQGEHVYFVHSYHARPQHTSDILATTTYGGEVVAIVGKENIVGTQFHPEKSQQTGATVLANFLKMV